MDRTKDTIAKYDKVAEEYARNRLGKEPKQQLEAFFGYLRPGDRVLDIGCSAGRDTVIIKNAGFEVTGTDLSKKLLAIAKKTYPDIPFFLADMRKQPFRDGSFDAIWANALLHHLDKADMPAALTEFCRVLAPGGLLAVRTKMGKGTLKIREAIVQGEEREFTLLTAEELDGLLKRAGCVKIKLDTNKSSSRNLTWLTAFYKKAD